MRAEIARRHEEDFIDSALGRGLCASLIDLNTYTTMKYTCGDRVKRIYGQSRPKVPRINALTRLPSTKTNKNAKVDPSRCCCSHQMDQHVLDIQRNVLFP